MSVKYVDAISIAEDPVIGHPINDELCLKLSQYILKNDNMISIDINNGSITSKGLNYLIKGIEKSKILKKLNLSSNNISDSTLEFQNFCSAISKNDSIQELDLSNNKLTDDSAFPLQTMIQENKSLMRINLMNNKLTIKSGKVLAYAIEQNKTIVELNLSGNCIDMQTQIAINNLILKKKQPNSQIELKHPSKMIPSIKLNSRDISQLNMRKECEIPIITRRLSQNRNDPINNIKREKENINLPYTHNEIQLNDHNQVYKSKIENQFNLKWINQLDNKIEENKKKFETNNNHYKEVITEKLAEDKVIVLEKKLEGYNKEISNLKSEIANESSKHEIELKRLELNYKEKNLEEKTNLSEYWEYKVKEIETDKSNLLVENQRLKEDLKHLSMEIDKCKGNSNEINVLIENNASLSNSLETLKKELNETIVSKDQIISELESQLKLAQKSVQDQKKLIGKLNSYEEIMEEEKKHIKFLEDQLNVQNEEFKENQQALISEFTHRNSEENPGENYTLRPVTKYVKRTVRIPKKTNICPSDYYINF